MTTGPVEPRRILFGDYEDCPIRLRMFYERLETPSEIGS